MTTKRPAFLTRENAPPEIAARWDDDWHFVGNVPVDHRSVAAMCKRCNAGWRAPESESAPNRRFAVVDLQARRFISGAAIITIYFGACTKCNEVHFATSLWEKA